MDTLFEQAVNISKAHAFDIVSKQVGELKEVIKELIDFGELEDLQFTESVDTEIFQNLVKKAKILSL